MSLEERYSRLNEEQKQAVDEIEGPVLVLAGPGTGKTELLSVRTANILKQTDALPSSILCITYTDSAAENMRERLFKLVGKDAYKIFITTFHGLGSFIINHYPEYFYNGAKMEPMDEISRFEIISEILNAMDLDSKLTSKHPAQGFTYFRDIKDKLSELKEAGITAEEFRKLIEASKNYIEKADNIISELFTGKVNKDTIQLFEKAILEIEKIEKDQKVLKNYESYSDFLKNKMKEVFELTKTEKTKPITAFKNAFLKADKLGKRHLPEFLNYKKNLELADIYEKYQLICENRGLYDFSDMILETTKTIEKNKDLHFELAEKFQYIMVDEFQDTNGAQMRLLDSIIDEEISDFRPNILAVGDDDQAIYKFQGAKIQNILSFHKKYKDPKVIVLNKNYRSNELVLSKIREAVLQGESRLENDESLKISKELISKGGILEGNFSFKSFENKEIEFENIAESIKTSIEKGHPIGEIAVLMRKNKDLENLAKILDMKGIKVAYEKIKNVLLEDHILELIRLLKYINSIANRSQFEAEELIPEILSSKFLEIPSIEIWKISRSVNWNEHWLTKMEKNENTKISKLAKFLIELAKLSKTESFETIIDYILGNRSIEMDKKESNPSPNLFNSVGNSEKEEYISPYKSYYFNETEWKNRKKDYLEKLKSLQLIITNFRNYRSKEKLLLKDLIKYIETHEENGISIYSKSLKIDESAVNLITIHSSKGLEFDTVFIAKLGHREWNKKQGSKIKLPSNMPISKEDEDTDDQIRLLYVGLSRARRNLYLSFNKEDKALEHLSVYDLEEVEAEEIDKSPLIFQTLNSYEIINADEDAFLKEILQTYKLSTTHLKNFLDLEYGGPKAFLMKNLLRFPEKKSDSAEFGSACHEALEECHRKSKVWQKIPEKEILIAEFEKSLATKKILQSDYEKRLVQGRKSLSLFYDNIFKNVDPADLSEFDFAKEDIILDGVKIKGKLDRIHFLENNEIELIDYKTGKSFSSWDEMKTAQNKRWNFEMQLYFYKILAENSKKFKNFKVRSGKFEFIEPDRESGKISFLTVFYEKEKEERLKKLIKIVWTLIKELKFPNTEIYEKNFKGTKAFEEDLLANYS